MAMANEDCNGFMVTQVEAIASMLNTVKRVPILYDERIGQLRDLFDIDLRKEFKESLLWSEPTRAFLDVSCSAIVFIVDGQRVKPKPYDPGGLQEIKEIAESMKGEMIADVIRDITECVCTKTPEICYPEKVERVYS